MHERETIQEQQELLSAHRRTLNIYLKQQAAIGQAYSPPALINGILETRAQIRHIKARLQADGILVSDEPDDEELPPPVVIAVGRSRPARRTALWLLIGALALTMVVLALVWGRPPSQNSAQNPTPMPLHAYSFSSDDTAIWTGDAQDWQIVQDGEQTVYEAHPRLGRTASTNPLNIAGFEDLGDYAVETRLRINQLGVENDNVQDVWLSMRAQLDVKDSCGEAYGFYLSIADQHALIGRNGTAACPFKILAQGPISFKLNEWHTLRAEVQGTQLRLLIDGNSVLTTSDTNLRQGFFYLNVGAGARAQFDDLKVYTLNQ